jgi:hypothetical protein
VFKIERLDPAVTIHDTFTASYSQGDSIFRADLIIYRIDDDNASFPGAVLERKNAGNGNQFQVVAEHITDLQFGYLLKDGREVQDPSGEAHLIRAVRIGLHGEKEIPGAGKLHKKMASLVAVRNTL